MSLLRWTVVTVGTLTLTTLGVNAFDNLDTPRNSLLGAAIMGRSEKVSVCPMDMVFVGASSGGFCIDRYEVSAGDSCLHRNPGNKQETDDNLSLSACTPVSEKNTVPWSHISRQQAELACVRAGKRLPTSEEWYRAALGTPDKPSGWTSRDCNVDTISRSEPGSTGASELCVSAAGAYDMIGNVWEWVEETVSEGTFKGMQLPSTGFVVSIDEHGMPIETSSAGPDAALFNDYFWVDATEIRGIFRGGYWKSQADAGQYAVNITVPPSFIGNAVGFRCVKDVPK